MLFTSYLPKLEIIPSTHNSTLYYRFVGKIPLYLKEYEVSTNVKHLDNATNELAKVPTQFQRDLRQKIDGPQILQKFLAFYGSRKITTAFPRVKYFSLF
jgi:hypothetical protein